MHRQSSVTCVWKQNCPPANWKIGSSLGPKFEQVKTLGSRRSLYWLPNLLHWVPSSCLENNFLVHEIWDFRPCLSSQPSLQRLMRIPVPVQSRFARMIIVMGEQPCLWALPCVPKKHLSLGCARVILSKSEILLICRALDGLWMKTTAYILGIIYSVQLFV